MSSIWKWAFLNSFLESYIDENFNFKIQINWKLQNDIYCIKIVNSVLSHQLFLKKNEILSKINKSLQNMNFSKILDIKFIS